MYNRTQPNLRRTLVARVLVIAVQLGMAGLLGACRSAGPTPAPPVRPAPAAEKAAIIPSPSPAVRPAPEAELPSPPPTALRRLAPEVLLSPSDLTFYGAYPAAGWRRCDDYSIERILEAQRNMYKVTSSIAAVWEHGSSCGRTDRAARIDEYAWLVPNQGTAAGLIEGMSAQSYLANVPRESRSQIREFGGSDVLVRVAQLRSNDGKTQFVAEIVGLHDIAVAYVRVMTEKAISDEHYLQLGREYLDRVSGR